jgi:hypothetical protein
MAAFPVVTRHVIRQRRFAEAFRGEQQIRKQAAKRLRQTHGCLGSHQQHGRDERTQAEYDWPSSTDATVLETLTHQVGRGTETEHGKKPSNEDPAHGLKKACHNEARRISASIQQAKLSLGIRVQPSKG